MKLKLGKYILIFWMVYMASTSSVLCQHFSFSDDHAKFHLDVAKGLRSVEIEAVSKIAGDFEKHWPRFTTEQKNLIIEIAKIMRTRRMKTRPYFSYYFAYITYAVEQAGVPPDQLTKVLEINRRLMDEYTQAELLRFYTDMNFLFGRSSLYRHHYNSFKFTKGSYEFDYIGGADLPPPLVDEEDPNADIIPEEEFDNEFDDPWANNNNDPSNWDTWDPWAGDDNDSFADNMWDQKKEESIFGDGKASLTASGPDLVAMLIAEDPPPPIVGPIIRFKNINLEMRTIYDSIGIKNASGTYLIKDRLFVGESGVAVWPEEIRGTDGVEVALEQYHLKSNIPYIKAVKSKMSFGKYFEGEVDGYFLFRTAKRRKLFDQPIYPRFKSHHSDTELRIPAERLRYVGGIALQGGKMTGESVSGKNSMLEVEDEKGRKFKALSKKFVFEDSVIRANEAHVAIYYGTDSIVHSKVKLTYNYVTSNLTLVRADDEFKNKHFESSMFKMDFHVDLLRWDLKSDSINFSIMNAGNLVPALFESKDYFHQARLERLTGIYNFNPLVLVVNYARQNKTATFFVHELATKHKLDLQLLKGAMKPLHQQGFIDYNESSGQVLVRPKAEHYVLSNTKKKDYDNLIISSLQTSKPNATLLFDSSQLKVRGVERMVFMANQSVYAEPLNREVTIMPNRDLKFDGMVKSGDFQYNGKDFTFMYDAFIMDMAQIDSIHIEVPLPDSVLAITKPDDPKKTTLKNHITETSGTLYINDPKNKSGEKEFTQYPYFISSSEAIVYFDRPEILNKAYDKSLKYVIPPFEVDSLNKGNLMGVGFMGTFYSGGIVPPIEQRLVVMPDNSLGFDHKVPDEGYPLYQGEARLYNDLHLDHKGLHANGKISHISTDVYSDWFTFYMDSVTAVGEAGMMQPGSFANSSYPQIDFEKYRMKWLPLRDSMIIKNLEKPFNFYDKTGTLDGQIIVTKQGTYGSGKMLTRGSEVRSKNYKFAQNDYHARNALFKILTGDPKKPAMQGDDVSLDFDLVKNTADIHPEKIGKAALSFPFAQMKTSLPNAVWYLEDSIVTMSKPASVALSDSYFFTTNPERDSLAFNATDAVYDIRTMQLQVSGIPFIRVADAKIIPFENQTTILENATFQQLEQAKIIIDTLNEYHHLFDGQININSSKSFSGRATYSLVNAAKDSFAIKFDDFKLQKVPRGKKESKEMTVSGGEITEADEVIMSPGFKFKGRATMYADLEALQLKGYVKPIFYKRRRYDYWIIYTHVAESPEVSVNFESATTESGAKVSAGLFYDNSTGNIYLNFLEEMDSFNDPAFFTPSGQLRYLLDAQSFIIETASKSKGETYAGRTFIYNENSGSVIFEGPVNFIKNTNDFNMAATAIGVGKPDSALYNLDALITFQLNLHKMVTDALAADVLDVIEKLGAPLANNLEDNELQKIADLAGEAAVRSYESKSERNYIPLMGISPAFDKTLVLSNVKLAYSKKDKAWYNTSRIGLSNLNKSDVNATVDGFLEIKKDQDGHDQVHLFLQIDAGSWYYFNFEDNRLLLYSSNSAFNDAVSANSNIAKAGFGQYTTVIGEQSETLRFINEFRKKYFGITEPYNLSSPDDIFLEDEKFDTIEKKKDGFGF